MRRLTTVAFAAVAAIGIATVTGCGIAKGTRAEDTATLLAEFSDRLAGSRQLTYTARYRVATSINEMTYIHRPTAVAVVTGDTLFTRTPGRLLLCSGSSCRRAPATGTNSRPSSIPGVVSPDAVANLVTAAALMPEARVQLSDSEVGGVASMCAKVTGISASSVPGETPLRDFQLCIADNGVLTSFEGSAANSVRTSMQLLSLSHDANPSAFDPPAGATVEDVPTLG